MQFIFFSHLIRVIGEVDFMEDLGAVLLDGVDLHLVWRELPGLHPTQVKQMLHYVIFALSF